MCLRFSGFSFQSTPWWIEIIQHEKLLLMLINLRIILQRLCLLLFSLGDYIEWHLDNKGHEPVPGLDALPSEVQLKHVINAWRTSVELCDNYHDKRDAANA